MTQEEKDLLLQELCARLPYGVKIMFSHNGFRWDWEQTLDEITKCDDGEYAVNGWGIHGIKPYLRPMSSMTEDEKDELKKEHFKDEKLFAECLTKAANGDNSMRGKVITHFGADWCNANHFDYRGLIEKGLAIAVTEENNPYNNK